MEMVLDQVCSTCGNVQLPDGRFCLFCGDLLSEPTSRGIVSSQPAKPPESSAPTELALPACGGFWLRVWAGAIDVTLEVGGALVVTFVIELARRRFAPFVPKNAAGMAFILVLSAGGWLYSAFTESTSWSCPSVGGCTLPSPRVHRGAPPSVSVLWACRWSPRRARE